MGALANAASLIRDAEFRAWMVAAGAYQARLVITEDPATPDHEVRLRLANDVAVSPQITADRLVTIVGTDPVIANEGKDTTTLVENDVLTSVANSWTKLAQIMYPQG